MMVTYFSGPTTGPLAPYLVGFREELAGHGYAKSTSQQLVSLIGRLSRWLDVHGLDASGLTDEALQRFLDDLAAEGRWQRPTPASFVLLLGYLRSLGVTPVPEPPPDPDSAERIVLKGYQRYLVHERGLSTSTIGHYVSAATAFLDWLTDRSTTLPTLAGADVITFVTDLYSVQSPGSVKYVLTGLRSFLSWVFLEGLSTRAFAGAVPSAAGHGSNLPQGLTRRELNALLASCDRGTVTGRRDYAILVLMSRLGMRSHEVAALKLNDVNWRAGDIVLNGKGHR